MQYQLFSSNSRNLSVSLEEGKLTFQGEDFGEECIRMNGTSEYEFYYALDEENTARFIALLEEKYGVDIELELILKTEFGTDDGSVKFAKFCEENGIEKSFFSF